MKQATDKPPRGRASSRRVGPEQDSARAPGKAHPGQPTGSSAQAAGTQATATKATAAQGTTLQGPAELHVSRLTTWAGVDSRTWEALATAAKQAMGNAYAPYSRFRVGAAIETQSRIIYAGCNVENISFGLTVCAERVALQSAVARGEVWPVRAPIRAAVVCVDACEPVTPCGACRQVLCEFNPQVPVRCITLEGACLDLPPGALLPHAFSSFSPGPEQH